MHEKMLKGKVGIPTTFFKVSNAIARPAISIVFRAFACR